MGPSRAPCAAGWEVWFFPLWAAGCNFCFLAPWTTAFVASLPFPLPLLLVSLLPPSPTTLLLQCRADESSIADGCGGSCGILVLCVPTQSFACILKQSLCILKLFRDDTILATPVIAYFSWKSWSMALHLTDFAFRLYMLWMSAYVHVYVCMCACVYLHNKAYQTYSTYVIYFHWKMLSDLKNIHLG